MKMPWMKLWTNVRVDRKLDSLSDAQHRVWLHLLVFSSEQRSRGLIRYQSEKVLALEVSRGDVALLVETIGALENLGIIEVIREESLGVTARNGSVTDGAPERAILFKNFESDVTTSDATVTRDRMRKSRQKKKLQKGTGSIVTPLKRDVTDVTVRARAREEGEEDKEKETTPVVVVNSRAREDVHDEKISLKPTGGWGREAAIAAARSEFGDLVADRMDLLSTDIESSLGGKWDCYLAAMRRTVRVMKPLADKHSYALRIAMEYAAHGIPPEPIPHIPGTNGVGNGIPALSIKDVIPEDWEDQFIPKVRRIS